MAECDLAKRLRELSEKKYESYDEFELYSEEIEDLCYEIGTCNRNCNNDYCKGLQESW